MHGRRLPRGARLRPAGPGGHRRGRDERLLGQPGRRHAAQDGVCGGSPVVLASGVHTSYFAIDATNIYWTDSTGGKVIKSTARRWRPRGARRWLLSAHHIAVDDKSVYWAISRAFGTCGTGALMKVAVTGGAPVVVALGFGTPSAPASIEPTSIGRAPQTMTGSTSTKMARDGGPPVVLRSTVQIIAGVAVDAVNVYWTEGGEIRRVSTDGGTSVVLATDAFNSYLALNGTSVFWIPARWAPSRRSAPTTEPRRRWRSIRTRGGSRSTRSMSTGRTTSEPSRGPPAA